MPEPTWVRITHSDDHRDRVGKIVGPATQAGMDVVVDFGDGDLAEFREWELSPHVVYTLHGAEGEVVHQLVDPTGPALAEAEFSGDYVVYGCDEPGHPNNHTHRHDDA